MPVRDVRDIRDLLVHLIGESLAEGRDTGRLRLHYPDLNDPERCVAHVLDGLTLHSLRGLIALREAQGWKDDPR